MNENKINDSEQQYDALSETPTVSDSFGSEDEFVDVSAYAEEVEDVSDVAEEIADVSAYAEEVEDVSDVAEEIADVSAYAEEVEDVSEVAEEIADVSAYAEEVEDVSDVAEEIADVSAYAEEAENKAESHDVADVADAEVAEKEIEAVTSAKTADGPTVDLGSSETADAQNVENVSSADHKEESHLTHDEETQAVSDAISQAEMSSEAMKSEGVIAENASEDQNQSEQQAPVVRNRIMKRISKKTDVKEETLILGKSDVMGIVSEAFPVCTPDKYSKVNYDLHSVEDEDRMEREFVENRASYEASYSDCLAGLDYRKDEQSLDAMPVVLNASDSEKRSEKRVQTLKLTDENEDIQKITEAELHASSENSRVVASERTTSSQFISRPEIMEHRDILTEETVARDSGELRKASGLREKIDPSSEQETVIGVSRFEMDPKAFGHEETQSRAAMAAASAAKKAAPTYDSQSILQSFHELIEMEKDFDNSIEKELKKVDESRVAKAHARPARSPEKPKSDISSELPIQEQVAQDWEEGNNTEHSVIADLNTMAAERLVKPKTEDASDNKLITADNAPKLKARRSIAPTKAVTDEEVISKYEIISEIERKGLGVTFSARNMETNRVETLKLLLPKGYTLTQGSSRESSKNSFTAKGILIAFLVLMTICAVAFLVYYSTREGHGHISPTLGPSPSIGVDPAHQTDPSAP